MIIGPGLSFILKMVSLMHIIIRPGSETGPQVSRFRPKRLN